MPYNYEIRRSYVFSEDGQRSFLAIRDNAHKLIKQAGAVRMDVLLCTPALGSGEVWDWLACVDRLVELKEILEVPNPLSSAGQHRIFTSFKENC